MGNDKFRYGLWVAAGGYLIYLAYELIQGVVQGKNDSLALGIGGGVFFIAAGAAFIFFGIRGMIRLARAGGQHEETPENGSEAETPENGSEEEAPEELPQEKSEEMTEEAEAEEESGDGAEPEEEAEAAGEQAAFSEEKEEKEKE